MKVVPTDVTQVGCWWWGGRWGMCVRAEGGGQGGGGTGGVHGRDAGGVVGGVVAVGHVC